MRLVITLTLPALVWLMAVSTPARYSCLWRPSQPVDQDPHDDVEDARSTWLFL